MGTIYQLPFGTNGSYTGGLAYYRFNYSIGGVGPWVADNNALKLKSSADVVIAVWKNGNDFGRIYRWRKSEFNLNENAAWQYRICYNVAPPFEPDSQNDGSNPTMNSENHMYYYSDIQGASGTFISSNLDMYSSREEAREALGWYDTYPITYHYMNSIVSGPSEAAVGDTVTVSAVPDVDYGITDASTQILVTNNDVTVPYTWDATNNRITFTMPDPS